MGEVCSFWSFWGKGNILRVLGSWLRIFEQAGEVFLLIFKVKAGNCYGQEKSNYNR